MVRTRYQVFISSTYRDLKDERQAVMKAVLKANCFPAGMELFPATDEEQFRFIKRVIDQSDYYLLIIAGSYGTEDASGLGFTEREFDYAVERGIPVTALLHRSPDQLMLKNSETDPERRRKLERFRDKAGKGRLVEYWESANELPALVSNCLLHEITTNPGIGWIRADQIPVAAGTSSAHSDNSEHSIRSKARGSVLAVLRDLVFLNLPLEYRSVLARISPTIDSGDVRNAVQDLADRGEIDLEDGDELNGPVIRYPGKRVVPQTAKSDKIGRVEPCWRPTQYVARDQRVVTRDSLCAKVRNLGNVPLWVDELGFTLGRERIPAQISPDDGEGHNFEVIPFRSRIFRLGQVNLTGEQIGQVDGFYVVTGTGHLITVTDLEMNRVRLHFRVIANPREEADRLSRMFKVAAKNPNELNSSILRITETAKALRNHFSGVTGVEEKLAEFEHHARSAAGLEATTHSREQQIVWSLGALDGLEISLAQMDLR